MTKTDIIHRLLQLSLNTENYWVITGAAMVLYGIREETADIDLGCTPALADQLENAGHPTIRTSDGTRKITIGSDVELFENWLYDAVQLQDGFPVISLNGLIEMKQALGRETDFRDIGLIQSYIQAH